MEYLPLNFCKESKTLVQIAKDFGNSVGTVTKFDDTDSPAFWHVEYDDGDEEDYYKKDLIKAVKYYERRVIRRITIMLKSDY